MDNMGIESDIDYSMDKINYLQVQVIIIKSQFNELSAQHFFHTDVTHMFK